jgi:hypothetical protein
MEMRGCVIYFCNFNYGHAYIYKIKRSGGLALFYCSEREKEEGKER